MKKASVAVIIPVYNAEKTVIEAFESVERQSFKDFVIIAVDDGSTDGSLALLKNLEAAFGNVTILTQDNHGESYTRNRAIRYAKECGIPFVVFLDADDVWHKDRLAWQMGAIALHLDTDIVLVRQTKYERRNESDTFPVSESAIRQYTGLFETLCCRNFDFAPVSYLANTSIFGDGGAYDERFRRGGDFALFLHFAYEDRKILYVDLPLYFERSLAGSLQRSRGAAYEGYRARVTAIEEMLASGHSDPHMNGERMALLLQGKDRYLRGMLYSGRHFLPYWQALRVAAGTFGKFRDKRTFCIELGKTVLWPLAKVRRG